MQWTYDNLKVAASKFSSLVEWSRAEPASYRAATRYKIQRFIAKDLNWHKAPDYNILNVNKVIKYINSHPEYSMVDISKHFKVTPPTLARFIRKHNIPYIKKPKLLNLKKHKIRYKKKHKK